MAHVLVLHDDLLLRALLAQICEMDGHDTTSVSTVEDALMVLRTSLHPIVAVVERDHTSRHEHYPLFPTLKKDWDIYGCHRYIALHNWELSEDDQALLSELGVVVFRLPFQTEHLVAAIEEVAACLQK